MALNDSISRTAEYADNADSAGTPHFMRPKKCRTRSQMAWRLEGSPILSSFF